MTFSVSVLAQEEKGLPPCSELKQQFADGTYRPTVTAESFIPGERAGPFHGDGRGFLDSPSNILEGSTSRISVNSTYESIFERLPSGGGPEFRPVRVEATVGETIAHIGGREFRRTGIADVSTFNASMGNRVYMNVAYSGGNPMVPGAPPIRMDAGLVLDFSTGQLSGSVNRSSFPAAQIFFDGQSVYQGDASGMGAPGLFLDAQGRINGVQICDPSK